eukprot:scaffold121057_cov29-Tisochrysis_lutea.AAC.2
MLDFTGSSESLGKPALSDMEQGLATAPTLFAAELSRCAFAPCIQRRNTLKFAKSSSAASQKRATSLPLPLPLLRPMVCGAQRSSRPPMHRPPPMLSASSHHQMRETRCSIFASWCSTGQREALTVINTIVLPCFVSSIGAHGVLGPGLFKSRRALISTCKPSNCHRAMLTAAAKYHRSKASYLLLFLISNSHHRHRLSD